MNQNNDSTTYHLIQWTAVSALIYPGFLAATTRMQAPSGEAVSSVGGYLYPPASEGVGLKKRGSYVSQLSDHSLFFYVPPDIDIKRDGTNGLKCLPKH